MGVYVWPRKNLRCHLHNLHGLFLLSRETMRACGDIDLDLSKTWENLEMFCKLFSFLRV